MFGKIFSKVKCPNCQMDKLFHDGDHIQICSNCQKRGYDYEMFYQPDGKIFLIVYLKKSNA